MANIADELIQFDFAQLFFCFLVTCGIQFSCFFIAYKCGFDLITDFAGGINFAVLAVLTLVLGGEYSSRQVVLTVLCCISRVELALFLLYRVCQRKRDARFDDVRGSFVKFLAFWIFQIIWVYGVSLPIIRVNAVTSNHQLTWADWVGWGMWAVGFVVQLCADLQKLWFRADPANKGKTCQRGMWRYSRHPNYFGEMLMWAGIFLSTASVWVDEKHSDGWFTIISPILTVLILLFLSGMPTAEGRNLARYYEGAPALKEEYVAYRERTPPITPCCPAVYAALPSAVKWAACCEFARYEYTPQSKPLVTKTPV